jgi:hypothetical protein
MHLAVKAARDYHLKLREHDDTKAHQETEESIRELVASNEIAEARDRFVLQLRYKSHAEVFEAFCAELGRLLKDGVSTEEFRARLERFGIVLTPHNEIVVSTLF